MKGLNDDGPSFGGCRHERIFVHRVSSMHVSEGEYVSLFNCVQSVKVSY